MSFKKRVLSKISLDTDAFNTFWFGAQHRSGDERAQTAGDKYRVETFNSFVPKLVLRRYCISPEPMKPPEMERYDSCVLFADISGFTRLTETLAQLGLEGVEKLTGYLNSYFGNLIELIRTHGGDIVKFAGDALLALFPCDGVNNLAAMAQLGCQCALLMQENFGNYVVEDCTLRLHIGIAAGKTYGIHVGKLDGRIEFFIAGEVLEQVAACETLAKPGEIFVSTQLLQLVGSNLVVRQKHKDAARLLGVKNNNLLPCPMTKNFPLLMKLEAEVRPYVPPAVLSYFTSHHASNTRAAKARPSGSSTELLAELRTVTVLFLDLGIPKSKTFCSANDAAAENEALEIVQNAFVRIQTILEQFEGTIRQFLMDDKGTVLIAAFGVPPLSHTDDPQRAVGAALEITTQLSAFDIKCSMGITTGTAFCGTVGNNARREYAIVGDIVNLSARLMAASKGRIFCDETTYKMSCNRYSFLALPPIRVKGKTNEISVFFPQCERSIEISFDETLIGRDAEMAWLQDALEIVRKDPTKTTRTLVIQGEAGIGKTRLLEELPQLAPGPAIYLGIADDMNLSTPFYAWRSIFSSIFDLHRIESKAEKQERLKKYLAEKDPELLSVLPLLNEVLPDLEFRDNDVTRDMPAQVRPENLTTLLISMLQLPQGSIIVLENAQWLDTASWSLVLAASQQLSGLSLILAMRPMKPVPFELAQLLHLQNVVKMQLRGLGKKDVATLAARVMGIQQLAESVERDIVEKALGNPFMAKEIATAHRDTGGAAGAANGIQGLITSKVDRLPPHLQILLKVASVVGNVCPVPLLHTLLPNPIPMDEMIQHLVELDQLGIIGCDFLPSLNAPPSVATTPRQLLASSSSLSSLVSRSVSFSLKKEKQFRFQDRQTRDVIYELMLFSQRRHFHAKIAEWYEKTFPNSTTQFAATIGYHWKNADDSLRHNAVKYFMKLGDRSYLAFANKEAINFFNQAVEITEPIKQPGYDDIKLQRKIGQACFTIGDYEKAEAALRKAAKYLRLSIPSRGEKLPKPEKAKSSANASAARYKKLVAGLVQHFSEEDLPHFEREVVLTLLFLSKTYYFLASKALAIFFNDWAVDIAACHDSPVLLAEVHSHAIIISGLKNDAIQAEKYIAQTHALSHDQLQPLEYSHHMSGIFFASSGSWSKARGNFYSAMDIANTIGDRRTFEKCMVFTAVTHFLEGDVEKSLELGEEVLKSAKRRADTLSTVDALIVIATALIPLGKINESEDRFNEAKEGFESIGYRDPAWEISLNSIQALLYIQQQEHEKAMVLAEDIMKRLSKSDPIHFFAFLGYYTPVEVLLNIAGANPHGALAVIGGTGTATANGRMLRNKTTIVDKALALLKSFVDSFPFAMARYHLWRGVQFQLQGKKEKSAASFKEGLAEATKFGLVYDEALIKQYMSPPSGNNSGIHNSGDFSPSEDLEEQATSSSPRPYSPPPRTTEPSLTHSQLHGPSTPSTPTGRSGLSLSVSASFSTSSTTIPTSAICGNLSSPRLSSSNSNL